MVGFRSFSLRALAYIQLIDEVHAFFSKYAFTVGSGRYRGVAFPSPLRWFC